MAAMPVDALDAMDFAFQPIINRRSGAIWARECLARPRSGMSPVDWLKRVPSGERYRVDLGLRDRGIRAGLAAGLFTHPVAVNILPGAFDQIETCMRASMALARQLRIPRGRLIFELSEHDPLNDYMKAQSIIAQCRAQGAIVAVDDFGTGHADLDRVSLIRPDIVKIAMELISGIDRDPPHRAVVEAIVGWCRQAGITVIAEGIETSGEAEALGDLGVDLLQGFYLGRPEIPPLSELLPI